MGVQGFINNCNRSALGKMAGFFWRLFQKNNPVILTKWTFYSEILICVCVCVSLLKCNYQCNIGFITISYLNRKIIYSIFIVQFYLERKTEREREHQPPRYIFAVSKTYIQTYIHTCQHKLGRQQLCGDGPAALWFLFLKPPKTSLNHNSDVR